MGFFDRGSGARLGSADAGVLSSWVHYLEAIDDDLFMLMGYDESRLQVWSASQRCRVYDHQIAGHRGEGKFQRPYGLTLDGPRRRLWVAHLDAVVDGYDVAADGSLVRVTQLALHSSFEFLTVIDDGATLVVGDGAALAAFDTNTGQPRFRASIGRTIMSLCRVDDLVVVGCADGAVVVVGPSVLRPAYR